MTRELCFVDFETRSPTNIRDGLQRYFSDPAADAMMLAYKMPGQDEVRQWHRGCHMTDDVPPPQDLFDYIAAGGVISAFNALFEYLCWNMVCVPKYGWPPLPIEQVRDTMAQAAAHNLPQSLEKCGEALGLDPEKLKSKRGKYLIMRLSVPHPPTIARPGIWVEDEALFTEFLEYNRQDVIAEEAISRKLRPLTDEQQRRWVLTQRINLRGIPIAVEEIVNTSRVVEAEKARLNSELRTLTEYAVTAASKRNDLLAWVNQRLAAPVEFYDPSDWDEDNELDDLKGKTVEAALLRNDLPPPVRRALEIRAAVVQTSTAKYDKMLKVAADDGTLKGMYVWHGAGTGRWASKGGINVQNFARPTLGDMDIETAHTVLGAGDHEAAVMLWGDRVMDAAVSCLRGMIKAPPGHEFINADFSSVENRVGVWLAGQQDKVDMFAKGFDEYKVFASKALYNVPYDAVTKAMRQMSKSAVLGCLFGQGAKGLIEYAKGYGVDLTLERSTEIVKLYREEYKRVKELWYECGDASIAAVQNPGIWFDAGDKLSLISHRNFLWLKLPSGRLLAWARPLVEEREAPWMTKHLVGYDENGGSVYEERPAMKKVVTVESVETKTRQWCRHPLIGSSIFQSAVQGTAADVLGDGLENVEAAGYPVCMLTHDELMAVVRAGTGSVEEFGALMCRPAAWREDLPLAFEGYRAVRYRK